jgi:hypothetical protein
MMPDQEHGNWVMGSGNSKLDCQWVYYCCSTENKRRIWVGGDAAQRTWKLADDGGTKNMETG